MQCVRGDYCGDYKRVSLYVAISQTLHGVYTFDDAYRLRFANTTGSCHLTQVHVTIMCMRNATILLIKLRKNCTKIIRRYYIDNHES
jgi:hypothetical protein